MYNREKQPKFLQIELPCIKFLLDIRPWGKDIFQMVATQTNSA